MTIQGSSRKPLAFDPEKHALGNSEFMVKGKKVRLAGILDMRENGTVLLCRVKGDPNQAEWVSSPILGHSS
jgi:hypothetical protein